MSPRSSNRSGRSNQRAEREENEETAGANAVEVQTNTEASGAGDQATVGAESAGKPSSDDSALAADASTEQASPEAGMESKADAAAPGDVASSTDAGKPESAEGVASERLEDKPDDAATKAEDASDKPASADATSAAEGAGGGTGRQVPQSAASAPASRGGKAGILLALLALIGVGVVGWQVFELRTSAETLRAAAEEIRQDAAQRISATDAVATEARAFASRTSEAFDGMQRRFGAVEARVADMEGQTAALEAVYLAATRSRSDQVLAEVEQAINAAAQQLQMAANVEAAVIALEGVEARLAQPEFGHLHALRRALVRDLEMLRALPRVDVGGVALRLELILERIDTLPLAFETMLAEREEDSLRIEVAKAEGQGWDWTLGMAKELGADVWNEVKGMIRLERIDSGDPVLLSPDQTTFLRENIKMRLLTARLALLSRDGKTYTSDVERAREWMERYFDNGNAQVQQSIKELSELATVPMRVEMPSLADTFSALRVVQARGTTDAESASASGESR